MYTCKKEKEFINVTTEKLAGLGIELVVRYFGIGEGLHMNEYMEEDGAVMPDIIVSADLEVFENKHLFSKFSENLQNAFGMVEYRNTPALDVVYRSEKLLPLLAIPLVYYTKDASMEVCEIAKMQSLGFGGINNSAIKSVAKTVWAHYGKDEFVKLLDNLQAFPMPIASFSAVGRNLVKTAIVPSVYALRADGEESFSHVPKVGIFLIPSYVAASKSVDEDVAKTVLDTLLSSELCDFYAENADLIVFPKACFYFS